MAKFITYKWTTLRGVSAWSNQVLYWKILARKVNGWLWTATSLMMMGVFISFSNGQLWARYIAGFGGLSMGVVSIWFGIKYFKVLKKLWEKAPAYVDEGGESHPVQKEEAWTFLMQSPSPKIIMYSSFIIMVILFLPILVPDFIIWIIKSARR